MSSKSFGLLVVTFVLSISFPTKAQSVCPRPDKPCGSFKSYELPFKVSSSPVARGEDRSATFYALILKSAKRCAITEEDRLSAQSMFARNKVFVSRFECDSEDNINYTNLDSSKYSIMAVYAGNTRREATTFVAQLRKTERFPDSYLRRMRVILVRP